MEVKVNALVIKAVDYKESDKILTLYSLERGKITAGIKGVKKSGAKLKFASEPFAFCEFILAEKAGRFTVIGASYLDSFFSLRTNLIKYYASSVILESVNRLTVENEPDAELFSMIINAVKNVNYQDNELITLVEFLLKISDFSGYKIEKTDCEGCGEDISGRVFFSVRNAEFYCINCRPDYAMEITRETYNGIKNLIKESKELGDKNSLIKLLKFFKYYLEIKTETRVKSIDALVEFLNL